MILLMELAMMILKLILTYLMFLHLKMIMMLSNLEIKFVNGLNMTDLKLKYLQMEKITMNLNPIIYKNTIKKKNLKRNEVYSDS